MAVEAPTDVPAEVLRAAEEASEALAKEADEALAEAIEAPAEEAVEAPAEEAMEARAEELGEAPAEEAFEAPAEDAVPPVGKAPVEEAVEPPADEAMEAPAGEAAKAAAEEAAEAPVEETTEQLAAEAAEAPAEQTVGAPAEEPAEAAEVPAGEAVNGPAGEHTEAPGAEAAEVPAEEAAEVLPADVAVEAPADEAVEAPADEAPTKLADDAMEAPADEAMEARVGEASEERADQDTAASADGDAEAGTPPRRPDPRERSGPAQGAGGPIGEEPRASAVKDATEEPGSQAGVEPAVGAPAAEERPAEEPAPASTAALVLLLVGDAAGSHQPQVFRMRSDQPLQRLVATYAKFRQFVTDDGLWLSGIGHGRLDATITAGILGLSDGDVITVHGTDGMAGEKLQEASGAEIAKPAAAHEGAAVAKEVATPQKRKAAEQPQQRRRRPRGEEPVAEPAENESDEQPKRPPTVFFLWYSENRQAIVKEIGSPSAAAGAKAAGERWKVLTAEEKAPYETRVADMKAKYDQAMADFLARGGVPKKRGTKKDKQPELWRQLKRPWGGAFGAFLRSQKEDIKRSMHGDAQAGDISREAERLWKELSDEVKQGYQESFNQKLTEYKAALKEHKSNPVGLMRSARVTSGAANGWTLQAWRNARKAVCFKISEPKTEGRAGRIFHDFKDLRQSVETAVYRQLNSLVRPGLLARLSGSAGAARPAAAKRPATPAGDFQTPKKRAARADGGGRRPAAVPGQGRPRGDGETPDRLDRPSLAARASEAPEALRREGEAWTCGCSAHLKRHRRCAGGDGGPGQPELVHLRKSTVTIGRAETCDVQLASVRTPQMLSRCHAVLSTEDGFTLTDKGSVNGCLVNGRSVQGTCVLRSGDIITFGVQTHHPEFDYAFETRKGAY